ncbi:hypothetical protein [Mycobacterium celatum]|uniref:hypothetical protein n=1 Tax=Mycobacterium celatum TaxID=28045 RepID=UPI000ABADC26|nr:hypothetical protein [Mycobacterium celatum]
MTTKAGSRAADVAGALARTEAVALDFEHSAMPRVSLAGVVRRCDVEAYLQRRRNRQWRNRGS